MSRIIGIDLGTTNSVVAVLEGGKPTVIANQEGTRTTPSVVAFAKNGERLVGQVAKRQAVTNPERTIFSIKRFMGRRYDEVGEEIRMFPFHVVKGENNTARVEIEDKHYSPPELSAMVLQKLKAAAEDYLGREDGKGRHHGTRLLQRFTASGHQGRRTDRRPRGGPPRQRTDGRCTRLRPRQEEPTR